MRPILYSPHETAFDTNGIGILSDAVECRVKEALNRKNELVLRYPLNGIHYKELARRSIILARPDPIRPAQPYRIYRRNPSSSGEAIFYARPLAHDLDGIIVHPFRAVGAADAMRAIPLAAVNDCPFSFWTDKTAASELQVDRPTDIWSLLGGSQGSILDTFGGEYEFDRYTVKLWTRRGSDRGVSIRYGKNLTTLTQDENCANCYTGVYPFWVSSDEEHLELVQLPEKIVQAPGTYDHVRIMPLDLSGEWQIAPSEDQLRERAERYIADNQIGVPDVSLKVEFIPLDQTEEYKNVAVLERLVLGDTVSTEFPDMGVSASTRVVETDYDVLNDRYNNITIGSVRANLASTIVNQNKELQQKPSLSMVQRISMYLAAAIMGAKGGCTRMLDTDGDGMPDELYIADKADPALAVKVWRFNYEGWAASQNGYNGPFIMGATFEDGILAHAVRAAHLIAGTIASADGTTFFLDLDNGVLRGNFSELFIGSKSVGSAVFAPQITGQYSPMVEVEDALANSVKGLRVYGKTVQSGTPAPESPVPLVSVGNGGSVSVKLDPNGQLLAISMPNGLPGMPLGATIPDAIASSKAHLSCVWWDEGEKQYYLSDYRDYGQAVDTQVLYIYTCTGASDEYWGLSGTNAYKGMDPSKAKATPAIGTHMPVTIAQSYGTVYCDISRVNAATIDEWKAWLASQYAAGTPMQIMYVLETPIVTPIPEAELAAFRALSNEAGQLTVSSEANLYLELAGIASGASVEDAAAAAGAAQDTANQAKADAATAQGTADNAGAAADAVRQELIAQSAAMNLRADGLEVSVTEVRGVLDEKADQSQVSEITEHFHFGADGMTIYNSANGMGIGVSEERVVFTGGEDSETIIRPADMETANLRIGRRLDLGAFSLIPRTNGNLSLRYTGGKT